MLILAALGILGVLVGSSNLAARPTGALTIRPATFADWPAIERILRADPRVVLTKARLPEIKERLRADPRSRFYLFEQGGHPVGVMSLLLDHQITLQPFYVSSAEVTLEDLLPLLMPMLLEERKDARAVINDAYGEVIPVLKAACGNRADVRPLTDQQDLFEVTIRYSDLLSGACQAPA